MKHLIFQQVAVVLNYGLFVIALICVLNLTLQYTPLPKNDSKLAHEFLGTSVEGKDMIIIDDMISSGESVIEVASALKERKANKIFVFATFGLFTSGLARFDKAYEDGIIDKVLTTNLIYQTPELLRREWYINCDLSKYIAYIIDTLNHDSSISDLLNPNERIQNVVAKYRQDEL